MGNPENNGTGQANEGRIPSNFRIQARVDSYVSFGVNLAIPLAGAWQLESEPSFK